MIAHILCLGSQFLECCAADDFMVAGENAWAYILSGEKEIPTIIVCMYVCI